MLNRGMMNIGSGKIKTWVVNTFMKDWKKHRSDLQFPQKSFNQLWKERNKDEPRRSDL
jgi:L-lactate dehydrogenase complex protein LldF